MKNQNHFNIPPQALELAHLPTNSPLSLTIGDNTLVVRPERMTALQALNTIGTLTELTTELIESIQNACGTCGDREDGCPFADVCDPERCPYEDMDGPEVELSASARRKLGIAPGAKLELLPDEGEGLVIAADYEHDITDVPENVLPLLSMCGVCPGKLDELIMDEAEVWHG